MSGIKSISPFRWPPVQILTETRRKSITHDGRAAFLMLLPFMIFFALFVLYPACQNLFYSFTNYKFGAQKTFIGLKNYQNLFKDGDFLTALRNTAVYTVFSVLFLTALGLFAAAALNRRGRVVKAARTVMIVPYATSMVAVSMIWLLLLDPTNGFINKTLIALGAAAPPKWLYDAKLALPSLIFINVWKSLGYVMLIYLSGLQNIPAEVYEAAMVDGAGAWRRFWEITLPSVAPVIFFVLINNCIESFKTFEQVRVMTQGGPVNATTTIVYQIYNRAFTDFRMGYAAAMAVVLFAVVFAVTLVNVFLMRRNERRGGLQL